MKAGVRRSPSFHWSEIIATDNPALAVDAAKWHAAKSGLEIVGTLSCSRIGRLESFRVVLIVVQP
jgi:hypothetical protein